MPLSGWSNAHRWRTATHRNSSAADTAHPTLRVHRDPHSENQGGRYHQSRHSFILRPSSKMVPLSFILLGW